MKKNKKIKYWGLAVIILLILLLVIGCSGFTRGEGEPAETTEPIETGVPEEITVPVEETTPVVVSSEPTEEPTSPTEPKETVPPTTEVAVTEPPATEPPQTAHIETEPPATEALKVEHTHSYFAEKQEASCSADGYVTYTCSGCGYSYTEEIPATGHVWSGWTVIVAATTENDGSKSRTCGNCGYEQTQTIAKLPAVTESPATEPPVTNPVETDPPQTEPPVTEAPVATEPPATKPAVTDPPATEPEATESPTTEPPATVPPETQSSGCNHSWEMIYHPEEGHYGDTVIVCKCGNKSKSVDEQIVHEKSFSDIDMIMFHGNWHSEQEYVIDSPSYNEWICSKCGASTLTQP